MDTIRRIKDFGSILQDQSVSVLIIGGGINGAGVFRDLALQGVDVLLVDKSDFCSGASAATSHMAHGGLRYLENGEFRLVREAVRERNRLINNAPHYVRPLPTAIPIYKWFSGFFNAPLKFFGWLHKPGERGAIVIKIALLLYDAYARSWGTVQRHHFALRRKSLERFPQLNPDVLCTAIYYDGAILAPERLCLELITDALAAGPHAAAHNYVTVLAAAGTQVILRDELTGERYRVKPKIVINSGGAWVDKVNGAMQRRTRFIGGTRGSHLILDHPELHAAIGEHEFYFENDDGRIVLIFPLRDKVLIGTSDLRCDDPDSVRCTPQEVDYFLEMIMKVFPHINVRSDQIVFSFCGVRPLPSSDASAPGQISRAHSVCILPPGNEVDFPVYSLIGGKWTTFRSFSEQVTDKTLTALGRERRQSTRDLSIGGGKKYPCGAAAVQLWLAALQAETGLKLARLENLFQRYGTRAAEVAAFIALETDESLDCFPDFSRREITFLALREKVAHLDDLILRRTSLAMLGELNTGLLAELADVAGVALGWSETVRQAEVERTCALLADRHGVRLH
jgi:glycerol-3-phosphate dehydrogenase